jgi:oligopeptide/dipeptide ABC transporter ATP-binding protein
VRLAQDFGEAEVTDNIMGYLWAKEAYGAMLFATALSDLSIADALEEPRYRPLYVRLAGEVLRAATARPEPFDGFDPSDLESSIAQGLLLAVPRLAPGCPRTSAAVVGDPPSPIDLPTGCRFHPRCPIAQHTLCHEADPELLRAAQGPGHLAACHFAWTAAPPAHVPEVELEESA